MGNNESVTAGNKAQADAAACDWYKLLALTGEGEFVDIMKRCNQNKDYTEMDNAIREKITPYLYNNGEGKWIPRSEIVRVRNCIRNDEDVNSTKSEKSIGSRDKISNGSKVGPIDVEAADVSNGIAHSNGSTLNGNSVVSHANGNSGQENSFDETHRLVCWRLDKRGAVGETLIHLCLLLANPLVIALAKRLLSIFPKLQVDIYLSDQYYGENILHIAIVNEDPAMVKFLLDLDKDGITHKERAFGVFFSCEDQKASRKDNPDTELIKMSPNTDYKGYLYWGEYPLSFAACLEQEECLRLLFSTQKRSDPRTRIDPEARDHNGNTVLHMLVIHNKIEMFELVLSMSSPKLLNIKNNKGLTPLTLAAAMAHKEMYNYLIEKERDVYWVYGDVTCAAYPLDNIDTIGSQGEINPTSALHLIIHGDKPGHLEMVDGMVVNLLNEKWTTFLRFKFYRRMMAFFAYFVIFMAALILRPGTDEVSEELDNGTVVDRNLSREFHNCYLVGPPPGIEYKRDDYVRLTLESIVLLAVIVYILLAVKNLYETGKERFIEMLKSAPSLSCFYISCFLVLLMVPGRAFCSFSPGFAIYEDILSILTILLTTMHFLFFCRGFKMVGPFVTMIYKMLVGDLLRFFTIYLIFLIGFSQAMYIVHINFEPTETYQDTPFSSPTEALMGMFYMSMGEFIVMYDTLNYTGHPTMGKVVFIFYMILVTLLLINMLIAMMGNTYTLVNETQKEWLRQWAHILLAVEQTVPPAERLDQQKKYSQPMENNKRALAIRWHQSEKEKEEQKKGKEAVRLKQKEILLKHAS
ncbi:Nan [Bugula neritina]|uniref:Nan n=1 Tax=Bugula neritina TaxID=10212 RepID=A0A7J7J8R2_BUGNE|nr:Nan [Bugula neritina]